MSESRDCSFPECEREFYAKGLCKEHRAQVIRGAELSPIGRITPPCTFPGCELKNASRGLCAGHLMQQRQGRPLKTLRGRCYGGAPDCLVEHNFVAPSGYVVQLHQFDHPNASKRGLIAQHTLVMSEMLSRPLLPGESVHHKNGVRDDNRPENLELWVVSQPYGQRPEDLLTWADEIIARYRGAPLSGVA